MLKVRQVSFIAIVVVLSLIAFSGCPKKAEISDVPVAQSTGAETSSSGTDAPKAEQGIDQKAAAGPEPMERAAAAAEGLKPVYFDFDRSFIRDDAVAAMKENAEWLKANPMAKVRIEGNCDERGAIEYNQALGQRRASSARKHLTDMGISSGRISMISYGEEKPVCNESNEDCWQKNRRADFVAVSE